MLGLIEVLSQPASFPLALQTGRAAVMQRLLLLDQDHGTGSADCFAVESFVNLLPNLLDLCEHPETVASVVAGSVEGSDFMVPAHRDFSESQPRDLRDIQQLDIKAKAVDVRR